MKKQTRNTVNKAIGKAPSVSAKRRTALYGTSRPKRDSLPRGGLQGASLVSCLGLRFHRAR